jgi:hypothetical membrane protein
MQPGHQLLSRLALAGMIHPIWFLGASAVLGALRPGYEPLRDSISELGEQGAADALVWNIGGFGVAALLYALYAVAIRAGFGPGWLFRLTVVQAILAACSGLFSCDPGCPPVPQSPMMLLHTIVGLTYFAITTVLPVVAWRTFRQRAEWRPFAPPSLAVGVVLIALFLIGPALGADRVGVWQRVVLLIAYAWQIAVAFRLHRLLKRTDDADVPGRPEQLAPDTGGPAPRGA